MTNWAKICIYRTIAFASRRLSRNSRIALDLAQVTSPKKFETEIVFKNENDVPNFNDNIMVRIKILV